MTRATHALLEADSAAADEASRDYSRIVAMCAEVEKEAFSLLALQQPVGGDLRAIFSSIQILGDIERMGALAVHVAKIALREYPRHAVPVEIRAYIADMAEVASALADNAKDVLHSRDPRAAAHLHDQDDAMDDLHQQLFAMLMDRDWQGDPSAGAQAALLGRFYERFADHAVEIGRRVVFMSTGTSPAEDAISTY